MTPAIKTAVGVEETGVWIPSIHGKPEVEEHVHNPVLERQGQGTPWGLLATLPQKIRWRNDRERQEILISGFCLHANVHPSITTA